MTRFSPTEMQALLGDGLLSFPVSHAAKDLSFDTTAFRDHLEYLGGFAIAGNFIAGGTGEFSALTPAEVDAAVAIGVKVARDNVPVIAPAGYGTALAVEMAACAEDAGADGIFLLPPYLNDVGQLGLVEHVRQVCRATRLGVIVYHRANARFSADSIAQLADDCPNLVGFKDGVGEIELLSALSSRLGDRLVYIGGLPTAETFALPYLELGVTTYSSAILNFAPEWASAFYAAVRAHDREHVLKHLGEFVVPYVAIRNKQPGYAVSIVKAAMRLVGRPAGPVRPPFTDLTSHELNELSGLLEKVESR